MKYFIQTFGCATNTADSQRLEAVLKSKGMTLAKKIETADYIVINTCAVRESAENRAYGLLNNLERLKIKNCKLKIIVTGCLVGIAVKDVSGKFMKRLQTKFPMVDEFLPIEDVGFTTVPLRSDKHHALVPISNGCNNFCTYCVVPFARGREVSRNYKEIIEECRSLYGQGYRWVTLLGQNVNSYGADLKSDLTPVFVKSMGKNRIPTLFPHLLREVAKMGFEKVDFMSSNPWDFSPELIDVIAENKNISREIHLPVQSGDDKILKRMNRWYTRTEYLELVRNLEFNVKDVKLSTDIIVGFPGETKEQFQNTVKLCKEAGFFKAYISEYSPRPITVAKKIYKDNISPKEKKRRWLMLEKLINQHE